MKFGLTEKEISLINQVLHNFPAIETVIIYGSRAFGTQKKVSDIDLVIKGAINFDLLSTIAARLEDLPLPYFFDVINYHTIGNLDLKQHIDEYGQILYVKEKSE